MVTNIDNISSPLQQKLAFFHPMLYYMQVPYDALHIQLERWLSWSKAHDWKSCIRGTVSRVRIPFSPPEVRRNFDGITADFYILPRIKQINFTGVTRNEPCTDGSCKKEYGNMVV